MALIKKIDGDYLTKTDGDKLKLVEGEASLSIGAGAFIITGTATTLRISRLSASSGYFTITGKDATLTRPLVNLTWKADRNIGPSGFNFVVPANKTLAPHSDSNCGYWWKGETYS